MPACRGTTSHAVLDRPDAEQPVARGLAVPAGGGLLADLRSHAHCEPHAWVAFHDRRLSGRHDPEVRSEPLAGGTPWRVDGRALWRLDGAPYPEAARRKCSGTGPGDARRVVHRRRLLSDRLGRRPDSAG